jgi:hypothetical protein
VFVTQLSSNAGISLWRIVWGYDILPFHELYIAKVKSGKAQGPTQGGATRLQPPKTEIKKTKIL